MEPGKQPIFLKFEEESFVSYIDAMIDFGFPLTQMDLRFTVSCYLNKLNQKVKQFLNNVLGNDWVKSFLTRYPRLKERFAANIKCCELQ